MAVAGYGGVAKIGSNAIAQVKQWELPLAADMYDVSVMGTVWKQNLPGLIGSDAKVDMFFDLTDTNGQVAMQNAIINGTSVTLNLLTSNAQSAVVHTYSGTAFVKSFDVKDVVNGAEELAVTLVFSGTISYT